MVPLFATAFQSTAHLDGIVFKFDTVDEQQRQHIGTRLKEMINKNAWFEDTKHFHRCFKVTLFNMDKTRSRMIMKVGLFGAALKAVDRFPASLLANVHEVHYKAYTSIDDPAVTKDLYGRIVWGTGGRQPTLYGQHPNPNSTKGTGVGVRIGDRNSDYGFVFYRRPAQRMGLELRIRDKACWSRANKALDFTVKYGQEDREAWQTLHRTLMHAASEEFVRDVRAKGIDLAEYLVLHKDSDEGRDQQGVPFSFQTGDDDDVKTWTAVPLDF